MTTMLVETFEVTEVDSDGQIECEAEALELIEKLGLEGQQKLISKDESGESTRSPYRKMTLEERLIYSVICPTKCKLREFSDSAIPVRVLQVAAHAIGLFEEVQVWSAANADIKDPVLVGFNKAGYTYEYFILARWGEVLEPLEKLFAIAASKVRKDRKAKLLSVGSECQSKAAMVDVMSDIEVLNQSRTPSLSDYHSV